MWQQCIDPPTLEHLRTLWNGVPVKFGETVSYELEEENAFFFETNRDQNGAEALCLDSGYFDTSPIPNVVRSELLMINR